MSDKNEQITELLLEFREFKGLMLEHKRNTETRLVENKTALDTIQTKLNEKPYCPAHTTIIEMMNEDKERGESREKRINELDKKALLVEYKLSVQDTAKVALISAPVAAVIVALLDLVAKALFH